MTKTMRRIFLFISILFCVSCYFLTSKGFDVRICIPFAATAVAFVTTAVMHP